MQEKVRKKLYFAYRDFKTAIISQIRQTTTNPRKIGQIRQKSSRISESARKNFCPPDDFQIRQKSARNREPARNIFCPPDDFQIRQNFPNLAEKTAIWQRCLHCLSGPSCLHLDHVFSCLEIFCFPSRVT
jgi:hypothetical protein